MSYVSWCPVSQNQQGRCLCCWATSMLPPGQDLECRKIGHLCRTSQEAILWDVQTSQVVKQYYRCLEEGSPYKDNEWARMQAECSSQGPAKPGNRGTPGGPPRGGPAAYGGSQGGGRGNAGAGRGDCFRWGSRTMN